MSIEEKELATAATKGATHLFIGKVIARIIGMLGGLLLIRLLTPEDYGLISIAVTAQGIFGMLSGWFGIGPALIKYIAEYKRKGDQGAIQRFAYSGFIFSIGVSTMSTVVCYLFAEDFAFVVLGKPYMTPLIKMSSLLILTSELYFLAESVFIGLDVTKAYAILMMLQEFLVKMLPIIFLINGFKVLGVLIGMVLAGFATGLIGVLASVYTMAKTSTKSNTSLNFKFTFKKILTYGIPLGLTDLMSYGLGNFYGFMIAVYCIPADVGNYNAANKIITSLSYLTFPILTVLFPMFSRIDPKKEPALLKKLYVYCVKYSSFLVLPSVMLLMVIAKPLTVFLFGGRYESAWVYLTFLTVTWLTFGLGKSHLWKLLIGQGQTKLIAKLEGINTAIAICLAVVLIPKYGIFGLIATSFIARWPSYLIGVKIAHRNYGIKPPLKSIWRIYVLAIAIILPILPFTLIVNNDVAEIIISVALSTCTYIIAAPLTRAIKKSDIDFLMDVFKPQPFIGSIVCRILEVMKTMAK